ncbi:hypothetical protein DPMN_064416 [Dreissena polymorpha]|uniref:Uncharacterized protein n=1 Tax=Dreissena polymorpha TaxID=45954 RepID=A0A9D4HL47_DREPO|nr:hypothetical protein DPMN_064416 [Dreissena polymorpha]
MSHWSGRPKISRNIYVPLVWSTQDIKEHLCPTGLVDPRYQGTFMSHWSGRPKISRNICPKNDDDFTVVRG